jgi:uncharacterized protein
MKPSQVLDRHRSAILAATVRFRATNPRVFGSVLNGQDTERSDLDLLVDLLTPCDLPVKFRQKVLAQAKPL